MSQLEEKKEDHNHEQWKHVDDAKERKKIQNWNAQRTYRQWRQC